MIDHPWLAGAAEVTAELGTDVSTGLSTEEVTARLARHGPNRLDAAAPIPVWRKLLAEFRDPLVYLLLVAVAISFVAWIAEGADGAPFEAIVITAILAANAVLGYVQEAKAEQAVAALQRMAAATSTVRRDGREQRVPATELVPGDILLLAEGDAVSADVRLVEAPSLTIAEAALTGESEPVLKDAAALEGTVPLGDRMNMAFSGTAVTRGRGTAVVTATGMATEMGRIAGMLEAAGEASTPLQREIARVGRVLGVAVVAIAVVVVGAILLTSDVEEASDVVEVLLVGVSLAVAAVPEGLPAVLSVVLALGVQRMAKKNAIVKSLSSVETLGSASVICSDKTGTLTRNEMTVVRIVTRSGEVEVTGTGYAPDGELLADGRPIDADPLLGELRAVLSGGTLASDATVHEKDGQWIAIGDPTEAAIVVAERKAGFAPDSGARFRRVGEVPFTSERKLMSTLQVDHDFDDGVVVMTKGAPDVLLARCTHERVGHDPVPLDDGRRQEILATVDRLAADALRTLGVAYQRLDDPPDSPGEEIEHELVLAGIVGIIDPPRDEAKVAIAEARRAGVRVVMITGDHPATAARIAAELGIVEDGGRTMTGVQIEQLDEDVFRSTVREVSVYARVAPEHKLRIVDALQADGEIVCMTGDGVNDAPALKSADIGVAMGITGTDVTKEASNMILADDDFATIVAAIREGRGIFSNIRKFLRYLLSSNAGEVLTMLLGVVAAGALGLDAAGGTVAVPLLATQILWINLLTDTAPALAMGVDPPPDDVMTRPPRGVGDRVIDAPMAAHVVFIGLVMAIVTLLALDIGLPGGVVDGDDSLTEARTMAFTTLVLAQLFNCFNARSQRVSALHHMFTNPVLWGAIALSLVLQVAVVHVPLLQDAFGTTELSVGRSVAHVCGAGERRPVARRAAKACVLRVYAQGRLFDRPRVDCTVETHRAVRCGTRLGSMTRAWAELEERARALPPSGVFSGDAVSSLPQPAERYLRAAIRVGTPLAAGARLSMRGSIKIGRWLPFRARQLLVPAVGTVWEARVAGVITGSDRYVGGEGGMDWKLLGLAKVVHAEGVDVSRSSAERAAGESIWVPTAVARHGDASWSAGKDDRVTVTVSTDGHDVVLEHDLDAKGEIRQSRFDRWGDADNAGTWQAHPFGVEVTGYGSFGGVTIPTRGRAGWHFGTPRWPDGAFQSSRDRCNAGWMCRRSDTTTARECDRGEGSRHGREVRA